MNWNKFWDRFFLSGIIFFSICILFIILIVIPYIFYLDHINNNCKDELAENICVEKGLQLYERDMLKFDCYNMSSYKIEESFVMGKELCT